MSGVNRRYCFTRHVTDDDVASYGFADNELCHGMVAVQWILDWPHHFTGTPVRYAIGQAEQCPTTGKLHIQGYCELLKPMRFTGLQASVALLAGAHMEASRGTREQNIAYCSKEESRYFGPAEFGDSGITQGHRSDLDAVGELVRNGATIREVATEFPATYIKFSRGIQDLRNALQSGPSAEEGFKPRPWQRAILEQLAEPADDRHIIWVRDSKGGQGKSRLVNHLCRNHEATSLSGQLRDMQFSYSKEPIVCFDISRAEVEHTDHCYSMAEQLKNGRINSGKYMPEVKWFDPPHVIFFSNSLPKQGKWSEDRVKIFDLDTWKPPDTAAREAFNRFA